MTLWKQIRSWLRAVTRRSRMESEMDAELRFPIGVSFIDGIFQDLRFGLRMLRKNPGLSVANYQNQACASPRLKSALKMSDIRGGLVTCPIKGNVKKKKLPLGSMPIFFSRHSARPIEAPLREWSCSGAEVVIRLRIRSGETLLPRGSIFATVTAPFVS